MPVEEKMKPEFVPAGHNELTYVQHLIKTRIENKQYNAEIFQHENGDIEVLFADGHHMYVEFSWDVKPVHARPQTLEDRRYLATEYPV